MTLPVGTILPYGGASAPTGFLLCYGQAISRSTYADLFTAIGTTYGSGDGSTTFNIPDLRGRVIAGQDDMGGTSANRLTGLSGGVDGDVLGAAGGAETHTLTVAELASHSHVLNTKTQTNSSLQVNTSTNEIVDTNNGGFSSTSQDTNTAGSDQPHNNVQPTFILNYIISTQADSMIGNFYITEA